MPLVKLELAHGPGGKGAADVGGRGYSRPVSDDCALLPVGPVVGLAMLPVGVAPPLAGLDAGPDAVIVKVGKARVEGPLAVGVAKLIAQNVEEVLIDGLHLGLRPNKRVSKSFKLYFQLSLKLD